MTQRPDHPIEDFGAILVGFDVEGFSRTVEKAALRYGRGAGELAAQQILAGERIATDLGRQAGLRFADALGDGAVYLRAQDSVTARDIRALERFQEELKYAHRKHTGLSVRTAWAHGAVRLLRPSAPILEHSEVLWGPAVARLHAALSARPRQRRPSPDTPPGRPNLANREGEITEMTFVFVRLCRSHDWATLDEATLDDALGLIARWAARLGGRLERITQDEKGVHVRVGLPGQAAVEDEWRERLSEPQQALRGLGLDGAIAAAAGPVYRGPSDHGSTIVHGGAVNRAAKLCAVQPPGGMAVDPSLDGAAGPAVRSGEVVVGRIEESGKARIWLAAGGSRLVLLTGEAGLGKTHLLRDLYARGDAVTRAYAAGAPARVLDPMGAWFELLAQAISRRWPGGDDRRWAESAFARAGLDADQVGLCARALRGVDAATPGTAGLSGGERAQRTHDGTLALIRALAEEGPMLIGMDDIHELDDASLGMTLAVLDEGLPVQVLAARRPEAEGDRLTDLRRHLSTLEIALAPLSAAESRALIDQLGGGWVDIAEVMAISGGNPFRTVQAALAMTDGASAAGDRTLSAILDRRLDRLDNDEREVLRTLAMTDRAWRAADVDAIAPRGEGPRETPQVLARLAQARLISPDRDDPQAFHAAHRLLVELIRRRTPAGVNAELARGAARRLAGREAWGRTRPTVEIARLWSEAGSRGRAAVLYERAAKSAAIEGADAVCAQLLALALGLFDGEPEARWPRRSVAWLAEVSRAQWSIGQVAAANLNARRAVTRARRESLPPRLRESALAASAMRAETGQFLGDLREILFGSLVAGRFGRASREHISAQGRGLSALGYLLGMVRLNGASDRILRQGERLASEADPRPAAYALTARAILHFMFTRWSAGEAALATARAICADWPQHQLIEVIETTCGIGAHLQGDGERALTHFDALAHRAGERGSALHAGWADYASAQTLLALERPHEGWARLISAEDHLTGLSDRQSHHICQGLRAQLAWRLGEVDEALSSAARCGGMSQSLAPTNYSSTEAYSSPALVGGLALLTPLSAPRRALARSLVRRHLNDLAGYALVFPIARPRLALVRAIVAGARRPQVALRRLDDLTARAQAVGLAFEASLARRTRLDMADHL